MKTKRKWQLILLIFILTLLSITTFYLKILSEVNAVSQKLLANLKEGNLAAAEELLVEKNTLKTSLWFLSSEKADSLKEINKPRLLGLKTAQINLAFNLKNKEYPLTVKLKKTEFGWKIEDLIDLQVYPNALVPTISAKNEGNSSTPILYKGELKEINLQEQLSPEKELRAGNAYYIVTYQNKTIYIKALEKMEISKVLSITEDTLEGEKEGFIATGQDVHYYNLTGENPNYEPIQKLIVGSEKVDVFLDYGIAILATVNEEFKPEKIRVALNKSNSEDLFHTRLELSSPGGLKILDKIENRSYSFKPRELVSVKAAKETITLTSSQGKQFSFQNRIHIEPLRNQDITKIGRAHV